MADRPGHGDSVRPEAWLFSVLAQNPISFAGDPNRADANALVLLPFVTYQFLNGWFVRSQPQMIFDWKTDRQLVPLDLGGDHVRCIAAVSQRLARVLSASPQNTNPMPLIGPRIWRLMLPALDERSKSIARYPTARYGCVDHGDHESQ